MDLSLMNRSKNSGGELDSYEADAAAIRNSSRLSAFSSSSTADRMLELQHNFIPVAGYQQQQQQQQLKSPIPTPGHFSSHQQHQQHHQPLPPPPPPQQQQQHHLFPFTASQWSELEHQALIFKYMMARAPVPPELIIPIRRSLILSATSSAAWTGFQMGASPMDAEPGRCRRTDGKKWRCSRPVVVDQKYCDRHMHRGRNRSRKAAQAAAAKAMTAQQSHNSPTTTFQQHQQHPPIPSFEQPADDRSRAHQPESEYHQPVKSLAQADQVQRKTPEALRHFFDDWPRESKEQTSSEFEASMQNNARRNGLIFPPLKLALDDHDTDDPYTNISLASVPGSNFVRSRHPWFTDTPGNPLGGPLAEALQNPQSASASKSQSQIKPVGFNLLDSQLSSRKQQQNIVASPTGVLQKIACFSDCSSSASSPGSIRTDNIPHSLAQVE